MGFHDLHEPKSKTGKRIVIAFAGGLFLLGMGLFLFWFAGHGSPALDAGSGGQEDTNNGHSPVAQETAAARVPTPTVGQHNSSHAGRDIRLAEGLASYQARFSRAEVSPSGTTKFVLEVGPQRVALWREAADIGLPEGQTLYARCLEEGSGVGVTSAGLYSGSGQFHGGFPCIAHFSRGPRGHAGDTCAFFGVSGTLGGHAATYCG